MFLHPQCACSRATLGELAVLMRRTGGQLRAEVKFVLPEGESEEWVEGDLWRSAQDISGVTVSIDQNGEDAATFGAETSGATLVYDQAGALVFSGGITAARGHFGDNIGRLSIEKWVEEGEGISETPVFGCPLVSPEDALTLTHHES